jgi:hypothetical protein
LYLYFLLIFPPFLYFSPTLSELPFFIFPCFFDFIGIISSIIIKYFLFYLIFLLFLMLSLTIYLNVAQQQREI